MYPGAKDVPNALKVFHDFSPLQISSKDLQRIRVQGVLIPAPSLVSGSPPTEFGGTRTRNSTLAINQDSGELQSQSLTIGYIQDEGQSLTCGQCLESSRILQDFQKTLCM